MLAFNGDHKDANPIKVLTNRLIELEKLQIDKLQVEETIGSQQWNCVLWSQQKYKEKQFKFGDHVLWFPKGQQTHLGKFTKKWFSPYKVQFYLPNIKFVLLVTLDKFDPNLILINVNKLKPYQFLDEKTHIVDRLKPMYQDEQKYIRMDDKEDEHLDESMFMIQMVLNNGTFMQQIINVLVKVKLDEKHSVIRPKWVQQHIKGHEVVVLNWHDVDHK